jgi:trimeric autotransporter adhesin
VTSISARSYVAAGLATAMATPAMIGLMAAQGHIHLPNFSSASVALSSAETALPKAQMAVASLVVKTVTDAEKVQQMAHGDSASASLTAQPAAAAVSTPDAKTETLSVLANAARAAQPAAGAAAAVQPSSAAVSTAAADGISGIIAVPALVVNVGLDVLGEANQAVADVIFDISNADFALATGQTDLPGAIKMGMDSIGASLRADVADAMARVQEDVAAIRDSLGIRSAAAAAQAPADSAVAGTGSTVSAATKSLTKQGAVHPNPVVKGDTTKADAPQGHTTQPGASQGDTASADTTKGETTTADSAKVDTAKASVPSTSTVSSTSTASNAGHSTAGSSAVKSTAQSGTSVRKHRAAGASSHAGGSGANKGVGASGRGSSHAGRGAHGGHHGK